MISFIRSPTWCTCSIYVSFYWCHFDPERLHYSARFT